MPSKTLLAIFAHPDDESFGAGGTLSRYAAEGHRVELICATRGEAGEISDPSLANTANLGEVRENELRCAARVLGIRSPHFLDYRDSGMAGSADNDHANSLYRADRVQAVGKVARLLREIRPDVLVTFEPNGGYAHPDHVAIHQITVSALVAAADASQQAEHIGHGLAPHMTPKVYYTALPKKMFRIMARKLQEAGVDLHNLRGVRESDMTQWGMPDELITTTVDVSAMLERKISSFWCHRTQLNPQGPFTITLQMGGDVWAEPMGTEYFIRVQPHMPPGQPLETDLFAGLL